MNDEERAARLLRGKNTPSVRERESMVGQILGEVRPKPRRARWLRPVSLVVAAGAAFAALVLMVRPPDGLTPRNGGGGAVLETICRPGPECTAGGQLLLRVSTAGEPGGYIAAFAQRSDGLVIWYFPEGESASSSAFVENQWIDEAVLIDGAHLPGEYTIHAVISEEPLERERVRELVEAGGDETHRLLRVKVRIVP